MFYLIPAEILKQAQRKVANIHVSPSFVCKDDDAIIPDRHSLVDLATEAKAPKTEPQNVQAKMSHILFELNLKNIGAELFELRIIFLKIFSNVLNFRPFPQVDYTAPETYHPAPQTDCLAAETAV